MKRTVRRSAVALVLLICTVFVSVPSVFSASSSLSSQITETQNKINATQSEIDALKKELASKEKEQKENEEAIAKLEAEKELTFEKKEKLDETMADLLAEIEITEGLIKQYEQSITYKNEEIAKNEKELEEKKQLFTDHIRSDYEQGSTIITYLEFLLNSQSIGDFISNVHYMASTLDYEQYLINEIKTIGAQLETQRIDLERTLKEQVAYKDSLVQRQQEVKKLDEEIEAYMQKIIADEEMLVELIISLEDGKDEIGAEIDKIIKEQEELVKTKEQLEKEEADRLAAEKEKEEIKNEQNNSSSSTSGKLSYDTNEYGTWVWPVDYKKAKWTSPFGTRDDPFGSSNTENHTGIDLALPAGNNIYAVDDGTVIISKKHYSYGNYVVILHDNGLKTLYAHASKLLVSVGDRVCQGKVIALIGSTGRSTGNHLHFSVMNTSGKWVNPMNFYPNLSKDLKLYD